MLNPPPTFPSSNDRASDPGLSLSHGAGWMTV